MRVLIAEDQILMREGLVTVLGRHGIEVAGTATDGPELVRKAKAHRPDLVLSDIRMPPSQRDEGLRAALAVRAESPEIAIVLLSQHVERRYATELLESTGGGGVGYLLKQRVAEGAQFCADLRRVAAGGSVLDPEVFAGRILRSPPDAVANLTSRQKAVLALMAEGRSNAAIAERLVLTEKAVSKHVTRIYAELGLKPDVDEHRRVLAVMRYLESQDARLHRESGR